MNNNIIVWAKRVALVLYAILTIATCAGVWNYCPEATIKVFAGLLFAANGFAIYRLWKKSGE